MVALASVIPSLDPLDWFMALILHDACFHSSIILAHRTFLEFMVEISEYKYKVLPFSLSTIPRVLTKVITMIEAQLRRQGIQIILPAQLADMGHIPAVVHWLHSKGSQNLFVTLGLEVNKD